MFPNVCITVYAGLNRKVVSLSCSPSGSKFVYATSQAPSGGGRLSAIYMVQPWRPQDAKTNSGVLAVWDMKSNAKEVCRNPSLILAVEILFVIGLGIVTMWKCPYYTIND